MVIQNPQWTLLKRQGAYMLLMAGMEPMEVAALAGTTEADLSSRVGEFPDKINGRSYDLQSIVGLFPDVFFVTYESVKQAAFSDRPDFRLNAQGTSGNVLVSADDLRDYLKRVGAMYVKVQPVRSKKVVINKG